MLNIESLRTVCARAKLISNNSASTSSSKWEINLHFILFRAALRWALCAFNWRERVESFLPSFFRLRSRLVKFLAAICYFLFWNGEKSVLRWVGERRRRHAKHGKWHSGVHLNAKYCDLFILRGFAFKWNERECEKTQSEKYARLHLPERRSPRGRVGCEMRKRISTILHCACVRVHRALVQSNLSKYSSF